MAQQMPMINVGGGLPPEILQQQQALNRQQQMAQLLMQQGQSMPSGQMVSGRYVAPSFFQYAAPLFQTYAGTRLAEKGDKAALDLAAKLRETQSKEIEQFGELMKTDPSAAYRLAAQSYVPELRATGVKKMMPEDVTLGEGQKRFMVMPDGTTRVIAQGEEKFKPPLQVDTGTTIEFRDPRDPTKVLQSIPKSQMPTAGQVVERDDGTFLIDTRTGQARPVMGVGGQQLAGKTKVLPEGLNKQVTGAVNLTDAISDYQSKIKGFGVKDFANPDKRAEMGNLYNNMMLQAKEAYNLGVLNGPDYDILQKVVKDPTNVSSLAFSNTALSNQADSLRKTSSDIVKNAYLSQGREVPADIAAKFVKKEEPKTEKSKDENVDIQSQLRTKGIPYQPKLYEYRVNPDGSVDRKRKIL